MRQTAIQMVHELAKRDPRVRRLAGRLLTDELLRAEADIYVRRYEGALKDTAKRDRDGLAIAGLLNSDEGRAFLLLDAAAGGLH